MRKGKSKSMGALASVKVAGIMPITWRGLESSVITLPITPGSPPNRRSQYALGKNDRFRRAWLVVGARKPAAHRRLNAQGRQGSLCYLKATTLSGIASPLTAACRSVHRPISWNVWLFAL